MEKRLGIWVLSALATGAGAAAQDDVTRTGKTFVVTVHPGNVGEELAARLADEALAAVEAVRPLLDRWQTTPAKPPVLHLHADPGTFRPLEKIATSFPFLVEDFCRADGSEAHVLLWPELSVEILYLLGLPPAVARSLQRCAAQATALQASEAARKDPWLAEVFAFAVLDATKNAKAQYGIDPSFDSRRAAYARFRDEGNATEVGSLLVDEKVIAKREDLFLRVERATLTGQLCAATGAGWARKLLGRAGGPAVPAETRRALLEKVLGKDWAKNEVRHDAMIASLAPVWIGSHDTAAGSDGRIVLAGTVKMGSSLSPYRLPPAGPFAIRGKILIAGGRQKECRLGLGGDEQSHLAVVMTPGKCAIHLWSGQKWQKLAGGDAAIAVDQPFEVRIEVDTEVRASIDGTLICTWPCKDRKMHGWWDVATNDSLLFLEQLRCEPLVPAKKK